jgi:hypothetical protein
VIIYDNDVVLQSGLTKGNAHDINFLKGVQNLPERKMLLGNRTYISNALQAPLFDDFKVELKVPFRMNQHDYKKHQKLYESKCQMAKAFFAQMCHQMNLRRSNSKSYDGLKTRLASKLSAMSILN